MIALRILRALKHRTSQIEVAALPIVGEGSEYRRHSIPIIGPAKAMPSGGFIYMDGKQFLRDVQGGLLGLTLAQLQAVRQWAHSGGSILAVGDIVPLLFAWVSGAPYAFVGTAKSEYYIRDETGLLPRSSWFERLESWSGSVYLPWERWLMRTPRCKAVFPRDSLTTEILRQWPIPAFDAGNPMMDDLEVNSPNANAPANIAAIAPSTHPVQRTILLLPGSRVPEAHKNWLLILQGVQSVVNHGGDRPFLFLAALVPSLNRAIIVHALQRQGWQARRTAPLSTISPLPPSLSNTAPSNNDPSNTIFVQDRHTLMLVDGGFNECIHRAEGAIAMAGTATEQFVGLGKPAFIIPGQGPQFTPAFAEAQTRLLGPSVILVDDPQQMGFRMQAVLDDAQQLRRIQHNGQRRMGKAGASDRIAQTILQQLGWTSSPQDLA